MAVSMVDVMKYFDIKPIGKFREEWAELSDQDKRDLKEGIENGSLTY